MALQNGTIIPVFITLLQGPNSVMGKKKMPSMGLGSDVGATASCLWGPRMSVLSLTFPGGNETPRKALFPA